METSVDVTDDNGLSFVLLACLTLTLAVLSMIPNYALAVILTRHKGKNAAFFTLRSCACADVLSGSVFLIFVFPLWIRQENVFSNVVCAAGGILTKWICLVLQYSLVFMAFQRYSMTKHACGWFLLRDHFYFFNGTIWALAGILSALPYVDSDDAYGYNNDVCHCALNSRQQTRIYDHLEYVIPGVLLFLAGVCLSCSKRKQNGQEKKPRPRGYRLIRTNDQRRRHPSKSNPAPCVESRTVEAETRVSFTFIAFTSSLITLAAYGLRIYGIWEQPGSCTIQAISQVFTFVNGITRSVTIFVVRKTIRAFQKERKARLAELAPKHRSRGSSGLSRNRSYYSRPSGFNSFSLTVTSNGSTHTKEDRMGSFWSDNNYYDHNEDSKTIQH